MIYEGLLVPHEAPPTLLEIKRALLTYDKVVLVDPGDRDLIPPISFVEAFSGVPFMGVDIGAVRPLGKSMAYDEKFEKTFDACRQAREEGLVDLRSTFDPSPNRNMAVFGLPDKGGYPLKVRFVLWTFRHLATNQDFLRSAIREDMHALLEELALNPEVAQRGSGDGQLNDVSALPTLEWQQAPIPEDAVAALTLLARARLGAFIKYAGYCEAKALIPVMPSHAYGGVAEQLMRATRETLSLAEDPFWSRRARILELCHEEFLKDEVLETMSVDAVLRLRTKAWNSQAEARAGLFNAVLQIAADADGDRFEEKVRQLISNYSKQSDEVIRERSNLGYRIKCTVGEGVLQQAAAIGGILQLGAPTASIALALALGGAWALGKAGDLIPRLQDARAREEQLTRSAGIGLHRFFTPLKKVSGRF
jgi:hypothetical protein